VADVDQFESLFHAHFDAVLRFASSRTVDAEAAKDAAAATFLVAWRRQRDVPVDRPLPWLLGVTRRTLADQRRSSTRLGNVRARLASARVGGAAAGPADDPGDRIAERDVVLGAFHRLRVRDREVLRLVAWDGLSTEDAAVVAGCSPATFAVRLSRARHRFDAQLAALEALEASPSPAPSTPIATEAP
jgi:RNA polymerase sigma factor (sigma-70 family)